MKIMKTILLLLLLPNIMFGQISNADNICLKKFYKLLFQKKITIGEMQSVFPIVNIEDSLFVLERNGNLKGDRSFLNFPVDKMVRPLDSLSYIMMEIKKHKDALTQGLPLDSVYNVIDHAIMHSEPYDFSEPVELLFPNKQKVFFDLSTESPSFINWIWLNNGDLLEGIIYAELPIHKMKWIGIINDKDGYVNVRQAAELNSKVVRKIYKNETFYYTPIGGSDWWPISINEGGAYIGFIHKSKVLKYSEFPKKLKDKVKENC